MVKNIKQKVLISGGRGLIGRQLTTLLLNEGFEVALISRNPVTSGNVKVYGWSDAGIMPSREMFDGADYIIHLAGANIGKKRWSRKRKEEIVSSRVSTAEMLHRAVSEYGIRLKAFISASATGWYGALTSEKVYTETDPSADDFLGETCRLWEDAADRFNDVADRVVKIRTSVVLDKEDSALSKLLLPARFGIFPVLGGGRQYMPWIHIRDLVNIYLMAIKDEGMSGVYNATAPHQASHGYFMECLASALKKPYIKIPVPGSLVRLAMGEMSDVILKGSRVSQEKIIKAGYRFEYDNLPDALKNILG